jgi:hypothetical protein
MSESSWALQVIETRRLAGLRGIVPPAHTSGNSPTRFTKLSHRALITAKKPRTVDLHIPDRMSATMPDGVTHTVSCEAVPHAVETEQLGEPKMTIHGDRVERDETRATS